MHAYLQEIGGARMTNVNVAVEGDLLTIKVDLTAVAKDLSHQVEEWQQTAERTRTQCEQSEWYLGEAKASSARLEEERQALREAYGQLEAGHREVRAWLHEAERERDVAQEGLLQGTEYLGAQLVQAQGDVEEACRVAVPRAGRSTRLGRAAVVCWFVQHPAIGQEDRRVGGVAEACRALHDRVEDRLGVGVGVADDTKDLACGRLLVERLGEVAITRL